MSSLFNLSLVPSYVRACWSNFSVEFFVPCSAFVASMLWNSSDLCCFSHLCWVFFVLLILNQLVQIPFHPQTFICSCVAVEKLAGAVLHKLRLNFAVEHGSQPSNDIVKCRMTAWSLETSKHSKETEMCPFKVTFCYKDVCLLCSCHSIFVEHYMTKFWWYRFLKDHADFISGRSHFCSVLCCLCL